MAHLNKLFLIGNLTRDPELRVTPKGTSICQFGIALNRRFKSEDGTDRDETTFVDIEAWGKQAELVSKYLFKGDPAMVEGRLKFEQWDDKQSGQKRSKLKVVLENVQFLSSRRNSDGAGAGSSPPARTEDQGAAHAQQARTAAAGAIDEDVPF